MRGQVFQQTMRLPRPSGTSDAFSCFPPLLGWHGPTLREFVQQIEHEFGRQIDLSGLRLSGFASDEALDPSDIRSLCELLGLPAEDFGVV